MNPKYFSLPPEKQQAILNAGFRVFSQNSYRKSPMSEIAAAAGISKALLFHYFHNKKELFLFLWDTCARVTVEEMEQSGCYDQPDLFGTLDSGMQAKLRLMRKYPDIGLFAVRAFYEKDPEISADIHQSMDRYLSIHAKRKLQQLDPDDFIPGIDLNMMYMEMYWASEGCLWEQMQRGSTDLNEMEQNFRRLVDSGRAYIFAKKRRRHHEQAAFFPGDD